MVPKSIYFLSLFLFFRLTIQECAWNACNAISSDEGVITAHLIPHTHDDLGWIKTVDQYYYGSRPDLVPVGVQYIYNTVIDELLKNSSRKFSFAETGFLWRWFTSQENENQQKLIKLVKNGQIEIIGGGWVQNDEATAHYVDIIDQMTLGLQKLNQIFGECGKPKVGWQIDPFGHSREMANIYAQMGYTSLYFARINYIEKKNRLKSKTLEFNWKTSDFLKESNIFTGAFYNDNYGPPEGFCWDSLCGDDPIMDNPDLEEYNVDEKVNAFVDHVKKQAAHQKTNQVMLLMGSDFQYTNANSWYTNLDKLIKYVTADKTKRIKVIYSTPSCYSQAALKEHKILDEKLDDFFPYASGVHSYWTGYFTSRPTFKGMIRKASSLLQLGKQLEVIASINPSVQKEVQTLRKASALNQHHDAVTGTAKEAVTQDYEKHLARGMSGIQKTMQTFLNYISPESLNFEVVMCQLANETICEATKAGNFSVVIFNSNSHAFNGTVKIPMYSIYATVSDSEKKPLLYNIVDTFDVDSLKNINRARRELSVFVNVPALGYTTFFVEEVDQTFNFYFNQIPELKKNLIQNEKLVLNFDSFGYLESVFDKTEQISHYLRQEFFYYEGIDSSEDQPSGAYIFRPKTQTPIAFSPNIKIEVIERTLVNEVRQIITPWIAQVIRLPKDKNYIEFEWIVGPIPKESSKPITKEIVSRFTTGIQSNNVFYTDSNGRQSMKRVYGETSKFRNSKAEPKAGNFYPITSFGYIKDDALQFTVLTDRSQGLTSKDGYIEIMIHRRCFYDDHFGVEEALNEPGTNGEGLVATGKHTVFFSSPQESSLKFRALAVSLFHQPVIAIAQEKNIEKFQFKRVFEFSALKNELPPSLQILSLENWNNNTILLRIENILHESKKTLNSRQSIDIKNLFSTFDVVSIRQLMLGANRNVPKQFYIKRHLLSSITINPSEILTFELEVKKKK